MCGDRERLVQCRQWLSDFNTQLGAVGGGELGWAWRRQLQRRDERSNPRARLRLWHRDGPAASFGQVGQLPQAHCHSAKVSAPTPRSPWVTVADRGYLGVGRMAGRRPVAGPALAIGESVRRHDPAPAAPRRLLAKRRRAGAAPLANRSRTGRVRPPDAQARENSVPGRGRSLEPAVPEQKPPSRQCSIVVRHDFRPSACAAGRSA